MIFCVPLMTSCNVCRKSKKMYFFSLGKNGYINLTNENCPKSAGGKIALSRLKYDLCMPFK